MMIRRKVKDKPDAVLERRLSDGNVNIDDEYEVPIIGRRHT